MCNWCGYDLNILTPWNLVYAKCLQESFSVSNLSWASNLHSLEHEAHVFLLFFLSDGVGHPLPPEAQMILGRPQPYCRHMVLHPLSASSKCCPHSAGLKPRGPVQISNKLRETNGCWEWTAALETAKSGLQTLLYFLGTPEMEELSCPVSSSHS